MSKIELNKEIEHDWQKVMSTLEQMVSKRPKDLNAIIFLIGVRELGKGVKHFSKEDKEGLMHIAVCKLLSYLGYYKLKGIDEEGWPHWELVKTIPYHDVIEQTVLIKSLIINYFQEESLLD